MSKRSRDDYEEGEEADLTHKMDIITLLVTPVSYDFRDTTTKMPFEIISLKSFANLVWLARGESFSSDTAKTFATSVVEEYVKCKHKYEEHTRKTNRHLSKHGWNNYRKKYILERGPYTTN